MLLVGHQCRYRNTPWTTLLNGLSNSTKDRTVSVCGRLSPSILIHQPVFLSDVPGQPPVTRFFRTANYMRQPVGRLLNEPKAFASGDRAQSPQRQASLGASELPPEAKDLGGESLHLAEQVGHTGEVPEIRRLKQLEE